MNSGAEGDEKGCMEGNAKEAQRGHGSNLKGATEGSRSGMEVDPKMRTEGGSGWVLDGRRGGRGGMRGTQSGLCKGLRRGAEGVLRGAESEHGGGTEGGWRGGADMGHQLGVEGGTKKDCKHYFYETSSPLPTASSLHGTFPFPDLGRSAVSGLGRGSAYTTCRKAYNRACIRAYR